MKGMIIGGLIGAAIAIGGIFFLEIWDFWSTVGSMWSMMIGFAMGTVFTNAGLWIGALLDDSY